MGEPKMLTDTDTDTPIQLTLGSNTSLMPIQRFSTNHGQCTLGVRLAPDGNNKYEFLYHLQQAMKIKTKLAAAPLGREHIWIGFQAIWSMVIQYPLVPCVSQTNNAIASNPSTYPHSSPG